MGSRPLPISSLLGFSSLGDVNLELHMESYLDFRQEGTQFSKRLTKETNQAPNTRSRHTCGARLHHGKGSAEPALLLQPHLCQVLSVTAGLIPSSSISELNKGAKVPPELVLHMIRVQGLLKHTKCSTLHLHPELQADVTQESVHQVLASLLSNPADDLSSSSNQHPLC